jgi:hypothetical protein
MKTETKTWDFEALELEARAELEKEELELATERTLVIGFQAWGRGPDVAAALKQLRRAGGKLANGYLVFTVPPGVLAWIDDMGGLCSIDRRWKEREGGDGLRPVEAYRVKGKRTTF